MVTWNKLRKIKGYPIFGRPCRAGSCPPAEAKSVASKFKAQNAQDSQLVDPQPGRAQPSGNGSGGSGQWRRAEDRAPSRSVLATRPPWQRTTRKDQTWLVGWLARGLVGW